MPIYRFHICAEQGETRDQELGFFQDNAAADYARRMAHRSLVEVWKGEELVASIDDRRVQVAEPLLAEPAL